MIKCKICNKEFETINGLAKHITASHKNTTKEEYYNEYIDNTNSKCYCGKIKKFRNLAVGYLRYCSPKCHMNDPLNKEQRILINKGRKQSDKTVTKRILNTNQTTKEVKRKQTCTAIYSVDNPAKMESVRIQISEKLTGRTFPRTTEHQNKIITSKRDNDTLNHSNETKEKISKSLLKLYASEDAPVNVTKTSNNKGYVSGYIDKLYYRSSYEKDFLLYCKDKGIEVQSAENKKFRVRYKDDCNKDRYYYPDFYLPKFNIVVEIKPLSMLTYGNNLCKVHAAAMVHNFCLVTEDELSNLDEFFKYME